MSRTLRFYRTDETEVELRLPDQDDASARDLVDVAAGEVNLEFTRRVLGARLAKVDAAAPGSRALNGAIDWFRPVAYELITELLEYNLQRLLFRRNSSRYKSTNGVKNNDFSFGLMAILADDPRIISDSERSRISLALWCAYRHYVPPSFVNCFARQVGNIDAHDAGTIIQPGFEQWIVERRALEYPSVQARGAYPRLIESRVKRQRVANAQNYGQLFEIINAALEER